MLAWLIEQNTFHIEYCEYSITKLSFESLAWSYFTFGQMWSLSVICRHQVFALNFYLLRTRRLLTVRKQYDQTSFWLAIDVICKFLLNVRPIEELWMWPCGNVNFSAVQYSYGDGADKKSLARLQHHSSFYKSPYTPCKDRPIESSSSFSPLSLILVPIYPVRYNAAEKQFHFLLSANSWKFPHSQLFLLFGRNEKRVERHLNRWSLFVWMRNKSWWM